jgi:putative ABC transport system ATP-binding protein
VTHNKEIAKIAHHVIHLRDGKVIKEETNANPMDIKNLEW